MKIYITHSSNFDYQNKLYLPLKTSKLNTQHQIILPHEKSELNSKDTIKSCDLVIAECSYPSTGSGIELGWANLFNIPIIVFFKNGTKPSNALKAVTKTFIEYMDPQDLIKKFTLYLDL